MRPSLRSRIGIAGMVALCSVGCSRQVMPKGKGASGGVLTVLARPETGVEIINTLTEKEKNGFEALHRPWDYAFKAKDKLTPAQLARIDKVKSLWDALKFGDVAANKRIYYKVTLKTPVGGIDVMLMNDMVPDAARNFIAQAKGGLFDGLEMRVKGKQIWFGPPENDQAYTTKGQKIIAPLPPALLALAGPEDQVGAERYVFCADTDPLLANRAMPIARITNALALDMMRDIVHRDGQKPGSVKIEGAIIEPQEMPLFEATRANVPVLNEQGEIMSREMGMLNSMTPRDPKAGKAAPDPQSPTKAPPKK